MVIGTTVAPLASRSALAGVACSDHQGVHRHHRGGPSAILRSWQTYALLASALVGFALQHSALKTGALAAALASSNSMTLLSSVALGLTVFSESLESGAVSTAVVLAGPGLIVTGVVVLAGAPAATARIDSPATD